MGLSHIFALRGVIKVYSSNVSSWEYSLPFIWQEIQTHSSCLCPPSVSASAQPALLTPPKRSMLSPSPMTPLKKKQPMISVRTRGNLWMTNLSWQRRNPSQVGWLHISSGGIQHCESKHRKASLSHMPLMWFLFQERCLSVACVPPLGMTCRRKWSPGRSNWTPTRSSWRRRCRRPGGWCIACR